MVTTETLRKQLEKTLKSYGTYRATAEALGLNPVTLHLAINQSKITPKTAAALGYVRVVGYELIKTTKKKGK
jgi:hypothetical protein